MKIKDLIYEAPLPTQQSAGIPKSPTNPVGNPVKPAGASNQQGTQTGRAFTPAEKQEYYAGTGRQSDGSPKPNQQMGQNPPVPGQSPAGQPSKLGQPTAPGQQDQQTQDPAQQFAQQLAQQTTQIGSTIKKELPAITKLAPGVNLGDPNKLAKDLALAQTQAPNKPLPPSLKPTFDKLGPVIGKMLAGDPSKLDAALKSAVPPK